MISSKRIDENYPIYLQEFWTNRQRQMHSMHYSISYRASFKPELPHYFIQKYAVDRSQIIMDPFAGRGTTILEANLMGFKAIHNDISPISFFIGKARQYVPSLEEFIERLKKIPFKKNRKEPSSKVKEKFYVFYHPETFKEILNLRDEYLHNKEDPVLQYIMFIALTRLHGHSDGFFSVYSFPQFSILPEAQRRNNLKRKIKPEYKDIQSRIIKKYQKDHKDQLPEWYRISKWNEYYQLDSTNLYLIPNNYVDLIITSPPFLDKVDYKQDNWLRAWFLGLEEEMHSISFGIYRNLEDWEEFMQKSLKEMIRITKKLGRIVIEIGEVKYKKQKIYLDEVVAGIVKKNFPNVVVDEVNINLQKFTKLSNCWKIQNNEKGTNSNRCVILKKIHSNLVIRDSKNLSHLFLIKNYL